MNHAAPKQKWKGRRPNLTAGTPKRLEALVVQAFGEKKSGRVKPRGWKRGVTAGKSLIAGFIGLYCTDRVSRGALHNIHTRSSLARESEAGSRSTSDSQSVWFEPKAAPQRQSTEGSQDASHSCGGRKAGGNQEPVKQRNSSIRQCYSTLRRRLLRVLSFSTSIDGESSINS